jgi:hypothetical protein
MVNYAIISSQAGVVEQADAGDSKYSTGVFRAMHGN